MAGKAFNFMDLLNAQTKAEGVEETKDYEEIYLSPYEVKDAQENTHQKLEGIEELADNFLTVGQEQPTVLARVGMVITLERVTEVQEVYEDGGMSITPTFGDALPETLDLSED